MPPNLVINKGFLLAHMSWEKEEWGTAPSVAPIKYFLADDFQYKRVFS